MKGADGLAIPFIVSVELLCLGHGHLWEEFEGAVDLG